MKNKNVLVLRVLKVKTAGGYSLVIHDNFSESVEPGYGVVINLPSTGTLPENGSPEWGHLYHSVQRSLAIKFFNANGRLGYASSIEYKFIFSNEFIARGYAAYGSNKREETFKELVLPMNEAECSFVFDCIPRCF